MIAVILIFILLIMFAFIIRLFYLKPRYTRLFKKDSKNKDRVSISYAILFDVDKVAKLIQKKLANSKDTPVYIQAYRIKQDFDSKQTLEQIKQTILTFQRQLDETIFFNNMYFKDSHDMFIEIWIKYSTDYNYRKKCVKNLCYLYMRKQITFKTLCILFLMFCGF